MRARRVGADGDLERTKPGDVTGGISGVAPHREEMGVPWRLALADRHGVVVDVGALAAAGDDQDLGERRRDRDRCRAEGVDRVVGQLGEKITAPVVVQPGGHGRVDELLQGGVGHRLHQVGGPAGRTGAEVR